MRKLLNTLYVTQENAYLSLDGENIVVLLDGEVKFRLPFINIESIVCLNYMGCSPALMGKCATSGVALCFIKPSGRFLARVSGEVRGNVHLRRLQYEKFRECEFCLAVAKNIVAAKLFNSRQVLLRFLREHRDNGSFDGLGAVSDLLFTSIEQVKNVDCVDTLRGIEGECARRYFGCFSALLSENSGFYFENRTKRPPLDPVNAMLSFLYTILTHDVMSALESVGLDPYIGCLHTDRSGRASLACDMVEELRAYRVDRFVLSLINLKIVKPKDFIVKEGGGVLMSDEARKTILTKWQERKKDIIFHPVIKEKIEIGLLPFVQAQLLAKFLRGEINEYSPYLMEG